MIEKLSSRTDVICWEVERAGRLAVVREDGAVVSGDPELARYLRARLSEPVDVPRRPRGDPVRLSPGDSRYVVARVRSLPEEDPSLAIVGIVWNQ